MIIVTEQGGFAAAAGGGVQFGFTVTQYSHVVHMCLLLSFGEAFPYSASAKYERLKVQNHRVCMQAISKGAFFAPQKAPAA